MREHFPQIRKNCGWKNRRSTQILFLTICMGFCVRLNIVLDVAYLLFIMLIVRIEFSMIFSIVWQFLFHEQMIMWLLIFWKLSLLLTRIIVSKLSIAVLFSSSFFVISIMRDCVTICTIRWVSISVEVLRNLIWFCIHVVVRSMYNWRIQLMNSARSFDLRWVRVYCTSIEKGVHSLSAV